MKTPKNNYMKALFVTLFTLICSFAYGVEYQKVSFKTFFAGEIEPVALSFEIPKEYAHAKKIEADITNVFWMRPDEVDEVIKTGDLPKKTGSIRGKITMNEEYSIEKGKFSSEDTFKEEMKEAGMTLLDSKRTVVNGYPVLAYLVKTKGGKTIGMVYVAMNIDSNVLFFGYTPPNNDQKIGKEVWSHMVSSLKKEE